MREAQQTASRLIMLKDWISKNRRMYTAKANYGSPALKGPDSTAFPSAFVVKFLNHAV
jgi:hypothetical protein